MKKVTIKTPERKPEIEKAKKIYRLIGEVTKNIDERVNSTHDLSRLFSTEMLFFKDRLQEYCEKMMFLLPNQYGRKVEMIIWRKAFYDIIQVVKQNMEEVKQDKNLKEKYREFLFSGVGYYNRLYYKLCQDFSVNNMPMTTLMAVKNIKTCRQQIDSNVLAWSVQAMQRCMIYMGDLVRYQYALDKRPNDIVQAQLFYHIAISILPTAGLPYNQLAVLFNSQEPLYLPIYYYLRCIVSEDAYDEADVNLRRLLLKCKSDMESNKHEQKRNYKDKRSKSEIAFDEEVINVIEMFYTAEMSSSDPAVHNACQSVLKLLNSKFIHKRRSHSLLSDINNKKSNEGDDGNDKLLKIATIFICLTHVLEKKNSPLNAIAIAFSIAMFSHVLNHVLSLVHAYRGKKKKATEGDVDDNKDKSVEENIVDVGNNVEINEEGKESRKNEIKRRRRRYASDDEEEDDEDNKPFDEDDDYDEEDDFDDDLSEGGYDDEGCLGRSSLSSSSSEKLSKRIMDDNDEEEDNDDEDAPARAPAYYKVKSPKMEDNPRVDPVSNMHEGGGDDKKYDDDVYENKKDFGELGTYEESRKKLSSAFFQAIPIPPGYEDSTEQQHVMEINHKLTNFTIDTDSDTYLSQNDHDCSQDADDSKDKELERQYELNYVRKVLERLLSCDVIAVVRLFTQWLLANHIVASVCAQSSSAIWQRLSSLFNYIPDVELILACYDNNSTCTNIFSDGYNNDKVSGVTKGKLSEALVGIFKMEGQNHLAAYLKEDYELRQFSPLKKIQTNFNFQKPVNLSGREQAILRLLRLRNDGLLLANQHNLPLKFDQLELTFHAIPFMHVSQDFKKHDKKVNKTVEVDDEQADIFYDNNTSNNNNNDNADIDCSSYNEMNSSPSYAGDVKKQESLSISGALELSHKTPQLQEHLMRSMAQLRLQAEVHKLESTLKSTNHDQPLYLICHTPSLCSQWSLVKHICHSGKFLVIVPLAAIDQLDKWKGTQKRAREVVRWLEQQFERASKFIRAQRPDEIVATQQVITSKEDPDKTAYLRTVDCCRYFIRKDREADEGEDITSSVCLLSDWTLNSDELNQGMKICLQEALNEGLILQDVKSFYNKWVSKSGK